MKGQTLWHSLLACMLLQNSCSALSSIGYTPWGLSRMSLKHREYQGIGYQQGYTSLSMFLSGQSPEVPFGVFLDGRAHVFNDSAFASNLGFGFRLGDEEQTYLFGLNSYYDMRWKRGLETHQISCGLEILTRHIDFRLNAYKPLLGTFADEKISFDRFKGHHIILKQDILYAMPMAEAELGCTLPDPFDQVGLYLGLGGYYLFKQKALMFSSPQTPGGKIRLYASPLPYFTLGADYSYDRLFKSRGNGFVALSIPLGKTITTSSPKKKHIPWALIQGQDPVRQEIIPYYQQERKFIQRSKAGSFVHVHFVDNRSSAAGDGTQEQPYSSLQAAQLAAQEEDLIYVYYGDGTTRGYDAGFTFKNQQKLIGSAASVDLYGVTIPALTPNMYPTITSDDVVIQALGVQDLQMQGLHIQSKDQKPGLYSFESSGVIHNNIFTAQGAPAAIVEQSSGPLILTRNTFSGRNADVISSALLHIKECDKQRALHHIHTNTFLCDGSSNGILLENIFGKMHIENNTFSSLDPTGSAIALRASSLEDKIGSYQFAGNQVQQGFNTAIACDIQDQANISVTIQQNQLTTQTLTSGIHISQRSHHADIAIFENTLNTSAEAIIIHHQAEDGKLAVCGNTISMECATCAIVIDHPGKGELSVCDNEIAYKTSQEPTCNPLDVKTSQELKQSSMNIDNNRFVFPDP